MSGDSHEVERSRALLRLAERIEEARDALARALVADIQVPLRGARDDDLAPAAVLLRHLVEREAHRQRRPLGRVAILLPSDSVVLCAAASVGAAFLAGNEVAVRLPSRIPSFGAAFREILEATLPGIAVTDAEGRAFLTACLGDRGLRAVVCFGDHLWVARYRDAVRRSHTKVVFEGPSKDPFLVFADADLDRAAEAAVAMRVAGGGQWPWSPERFYVEESALEGFLGRILERVQRLRVGPAAAETTDVGPLRSPVVLERLKKQLGDARARGARIVHGGEFVRVPGGRYETCLPTVVVDGTHDMDLFREETAGPVMPIMTFKSTAEALDLADDARFGRLATAYGGTAETAQWLRDSHARVFHNDCALDLGPQALAWGGFRSSAWVWEWWDGHFVHREGPHDFLRELSEPAEGGGE